MEIEWDHKNDAITHYVSFINKRDYISIFVSLDSFPKTPTVLVPHAFCVEEEIHIAYRQWGSNQRLHKSKGAENDMKKS